MSRTERTARRLASRAGRFLADRGADPASKSLAEPAPTEAPERTRRDRRRRRRRRGREYSEDMD